MQPIISICIPTFNRATCLENLLNNLSALTTAYKTVVEICISNNYSSDNTIQVIDSWRDKLQLKVVTQSQNIGATKNIVEVTRLATGKWILIMGDDDELITSAFSSLLAYLNAAGEKDWILAGVADKLGNEHLLGDLLPGIYQAQRFRNIVLRTGLYRYGFIGMHIFPSGWSKQLLDLSTQAIQPWPHVALFLRNLEVGCVRVFPVSIVKQAAGGSELYWNPGDWVSINLRKLNILSEARKEMHKIRWFFDFLMLRELYSLRTFKDLILWKVLDPVDFQRRALREFISSYRLLSPIGGIATSLHCVGVFLALYTPSIVLEMIFYLSGQHGVLAFHRELKKKLGSFDGVKRGL